MLKFTSILKKVLPQQQISSFEIQVTGIGYVPELGVTVNGLEIEPNFRIITGIDSSSKTNIDLTIIQPPIDENCTEEYFRSILNLSGVKVLSITPIQNGYHPRKISEYTLARPWYLVQVPAGLLKMGWRKRVISIDWSRSDVKKIVTEDDVTKDEVSVHAWGPAKAVEYLSVIKKELNKT